MLKLLLCLIFVVTKLNAKDYDPAVIDKGYKRISDLKDKYYKQLYQNTADAKKKYESAVKAFKAGKSEKLVKKSSMRLKELKNAPKSKTIS